MSKDNKKLRISHGSTLYIDNPQPITIAELGVKLKAKGLKAKTDRIRKHFAEHGKDEVLSNLKGKLPTVWWGVILNGGTGEQNVFSYTGLLLLDLDGSPSEKSIERLKQDKHLFHIRKSARGSGYHAIFKIPIVDDRNEYKQRWEAASEYLLKEYSIYADKNATNAEKAAYLSYDPQPYFNESCDTFTDIIEDSIGAPQIPVDIVEADDELERVTVWLCDHPSTYSDREVWRNIGFGIKAKYGQSGYDHFIRICEAGAEGSKGQPKDWDKLWKNSDPRGEGDIKFGSIIKLLDENGFDINHDAGIFNKIKEVGSDEVEGIRALARKALFDHSSEVEKPPTFLAVGGEIFGTEGNISMLLGKAKSGKSFTVSMAAAALIEGSTIGFSGFMPKDGTLLYFDTEQSTYHVSVISKRIEILRESNNPNNFPLYELRQFAKDDMTKIIEQVLNDTPKAAFVIIDGVRDLVFDINNPSEAVDVSRWLLKLSDIHRVHIMLVLHTNKNDSNSRGHLGSELNNKCETVASVEYKKDEGAIVVKQELGRNKSFEPFAFRINENGIPIIMGVPESKKAKNEVYDTNELAIALNSIYGGKDVLTKTVISDGIKKVFGVGDTKARVIFEAMIGGGIIENISENKSRGQWKKVEEIVSDELV